MKLKQWFRPPRHLVFIFLLISMGPAAALGWLSYRLLEQDRALEAQRIQERLENAADVVSAYLDQAQSKVEETLAHLASLPEADLAAAASQEVKGFGDAVLLVVFQKEEVLAFPREQLLYYPYLPPIQEPSATVFSAGENYEYRQQDYSRAIAIFRKLSASSDTTTRAGALVRLARNLRKSGQFDEALATYGELERMESTRIGSIGVPTELLARHSRCSVLEELERRSDLLSEAEGLIRDLEGVRWQISRAAFDYYRQETSRWLGPQEDDRAGQTAEKQALSAAVEYLWDDRESILQDSESPKGRRSLWLNGQPVLLVWDSTPQQLVAFMAGCRHFEEQIRTLMSTGMSGRPLQPALADIEGHAVVGRIPSAGTPYAQRTAADFRLPWTLYMTSSNPAADIADLASRRRLLLGGLAMMAVLLIAGIYFIGRSVTRELELAQLKSDFVSAVSHEFRSPLTSMRQLTNMLVAGRVPNEERRKSYYDLLSTETVRLQRFVESLLDFGRMEAGAMEYSLEPTNATDLVRRIVTDFQREVQEDGYRIELVADGPGRVIRADQEALARALWNLLDNAVKYSPNCMTVRVELAREAHEIFIRVQDRGVGMSPGEQREIFRKFVRGAAAESTHAKGTGIGLAMVDHIVRAHGGRICVESEPGRGSTFTLILPAEE